LTSRRFQILPNHMMNVCGKFHWHPSTKQSDRSYYITQTVLTDGPTSCMVTEGIKSYIMFWHHKDYSWLLILTFVWLCLLHCRSDQLTFTDWISAYRHHQLFCFVWYDSLVVVNDWLLQLLTPRPLLLHVSSLHPTIPNVSLSNFTVETHRNTHMDTHAIF